MAVHWDVVEVRYVRDRELHVRFADGLEGDITFASSFFKGVFEHLKDSDEFKRVMLGNGFVTWPGELDLAPDSMYAQIKKHGCYRIS